MRTGRDGKIWQTTVQISYDLYKQAREQHIGLSSTLNRALKARLDRDYEDPQKLRKKVEFLAGELIKLQKQHWKLQSDIKDLGLIKKFDVEGKRL